MRPFEILLGEANKQGETTGVATCKCEFSSED